MKLTQKSVCEDNFAGEQKTYIDLGHINSCEGNKMKIIHSTQHRDNSNRKRKRRNISERVRFKVFRRDGFTCQYCGRVATDMELSIDHIIPVSKNGTNDDNNLITACMVCNRGKYDEDVPLKEIKTYTEETVYITNPFPQSDIISYKAILDFLDFDKNIVHRAIMRYKQGEQPTPQNENLPPKKEYSSVRLHGEQFKLGMDDTDIDDDDSLNRSKQDPKILAMLNNRTQGLPLHEWIERLTWQ